MGRGEAVPYARYGESEESVLEQINTIKNDLQNGIDNVNLNTLLPAGAARNAVDCALWDLESKIKDTPVWKLLKREEPKNCLLYTSPSPRDGLLSRMPSSA